MLADWARRLDRADNPYLEIDWKAETAAAAIPANKVVHNMGGPVSVGSELLRSRRLSSLQFSTPCATDRRAGGAQNIFMAWGRRKWVGVSRRVGALPRVRASVCIFQTGRDSDEGVADITAR